jgi:hypothetical protein
MNIKILRTTFFAGPNPWCYKPAFEAFVDIGRFEQFPSNLLEGFATRLAHKLPGLDQHRCGVGVVGGFVQRLHEGTWIGHIIEHVAIEIQKLVGINVGFGKTRQTAEPNIYKVVFRAPNERIGRFALDAACGLVLAMVKDLDYDLPGLLQQFTELVDLVNVNSNIGAIMEAADQRKIPWIRLADNNLVQLGHGHLQRRISSSWPNKIPDIEMVSSRDKNPSTLVDDLFPVPTQGRIPIVGITGARDSSLIAQLIAHLVSIQYACIGLATVDGSYVGSNQLSQYSAVSRQAGEQLLLHHDVNAAVMQHCPKKILEEGLAYDRCSLGIVTDLTMQDAYAEHYVYKPDDLFTVLRTQIDVILPTGVAILNADDPYVLDMLPLCDGEVILYSTSSSFEELKLNHKEHICVFLNGAYIIRSCGSEEHILMDMSLLRPDLAAELEAVLVAVAASIVFNIDPNIIVNQLNTFKKLKGSALHEARHPGRGF